jgi:single-strand DNA-binding protein
MNTKSFRNEFCVLGHAGADPIVREQPTLVATFTLATNYSHRDPATGAWQEATEWHRLCAFGDEAEQVQRGLRKGMRVQAQGFMRTRKFVDKAGQERYAHELVATRIETGAAIEALAEPGAEDSREPVPII